MARGACARLKPNFEPAWPVRIAACVSATTPGVTRISTLAGCPSASSLSMSSKLSTTMRAPASTAACSSRADFALPCSRIRSPLKPAVRASASSPPDATSTLRPSSSNTRSTAVHGNALEAKITSPSPMAVLNSRARPRRSSSATAYSGVPNSRARSAASQPPMLRRPSSTLEARGYRWVAVAGTAREVRGSPGNGRRDRRGAATSGMSVFPGGPSGRARGGRGHAAAEHEQQGHAGDHEAHRHPLRLRQPEGDADRCGAGTRSGSARRPTPIR